MGFMINPSLVLAVELDGFRKYFPFLLLLLSSLRNYLIPMIIL